jgi:hypothetical protein
MIFFIFKNFLFAGATVQDPGQIFITHFVPERGPNPLLFELPLCTDRMRTHAYWTALYAAPT